MSHQAPLSITVNNATQPSTTRTHENPADPRTPRHIRSQSKDLSQPQPMSIDAMTRSSFAQSLNLPKVNRESRAYTKKKLLWDAWNELEWRDEYDGQKAYETYSQLKQRYGEKHPSPAELRPPSMVRQFSMERQRTNLIRHASAPPPLFNYSTSQQASQQLHTQPSITSSISAPLPHLTSTSSSSSSSSSSSTSPSTSPFAAASAASSAASLLPPTNPLWPRQNSAPLPTDPATALMSLTTDDSAVIPHARQRRESDSADKMSDEDFNQWEYYDDSDDEEETESDTTTLPVDTDDQHPFGPPPAAVNSQQAPIIMPVKSQLSELTDDDPLTEEFLAHMMDEFRMHIPASFNNAFQILKRVLPMLTASPNLVYLTIHPQTKLTVVGDLHGQLEDLLTIFKLNGLPSDRNQYLFNGDFVDRGQHSCEIVLILMSWKLLKPSAIHFNRGNHESADINSRDGFEKECIQKYDSDLYDLFGEIFAALPLAHVVGKKVFIVHGGLCQYDIRLSDIAAAYRFSVIPPKHSIIEDLLWSDPTNKEGRHPNSRGCALEFGVDVVRRFLSDNNLSYIIRSHECVDDGYEKWFDGLLYTVFSASNYCGVVGNAGAVMLLESNLEPQPVVYMARNKNVRKSTRLGRLHDEVLRRLIVRIISNRLGLINYYVNISHDGLVTRRQWADGLRIVLDLNIPFLKFQSFLGLPKLGAKGQPGGDIDYMDFLSRFRPQPRTVKPRKPGHSRSASASDPKTVISEAKSSFLSMNFESYPSSEKKSTTLVPPNATRPIMTDDDVALMAEINEMLFAKRYELEALFRFFDHNGDGCINDIEFRDGLQSLSEVLGRRFTEQQLDRIVSILDADGDGTIAYSEFFQSFRPVDAALAARLNPHDQHKLSTSSTSSSSSSSTSTSTSTSAPSSISTSTTTPHLR